MKNYFYSDRCEGFSHIDVDAGLRASVGNLANYKKALFAALKGIRGKLPIIFGMIDSNEYDGFVTIASTLSRICTSIGAAGIGEEIEYLQNTALNRNTAELKVSLPRLGRELEQLLTELEELLREMDRMEKSGENYIFASSPLHNFLNENYKAI